MTGAWRNCRHCRRPLRSPRPDSEYCTATACQSAKRKARRWAQNGRPAWARPEVALCRRCHATSPTGTPWCESCQAEDAAKRAADEAHALTLRAVAIGAVMLGKVRRAPARCWHCRAPIMRGRYCADRPDCQTARRAAKRGAARQEAAAREAWAERVQHLARRLVIARRQGDDVARRWLDSHAASGGSAAVAAIVEAADALANRDTLFDMAAGADGGAPT